MKIEFDLSCNLEFHHSKKDCFYNTTKPRILIFVDNSLDGNEYTILLNEELSTFNNSIQKYNNNTHETALMNFNEFFRNIGLNVKNKDQSIYSDYHHLLENQFSTDSSLLFYVYGNHMNTSGLPCQVLVGFGSLNIYSIFSQLKESSQLEIELKISNREYNIGQIKLFFKKDSIQMGMKESWKDICHKDIIKISKNHQEKEMYFLNSKFKMIWHGISKMRCLRNYSISSESIPIAYFMQDLIKIKEEGFKILLMYAIKRYSTEKCMNYVDCFENFKKFDLKQKKSILSIMLTLIPNSHNYNGDYHILPNGSIEFIETFQSPSKSDTGDCEDFSFLVCLICETFCALEKPSDPIMRELWYIAKMYIPFICLCRTTLASISMMTLNENKRENITTCRTTFKNEIEYEEWVKSKMDECQSSNTNVSAHMTGILISIPQFLEHFDNQNIQKSDEDESMFRNVNKTFGTKFHVSNVLRQKLSDDFSLILRNYNDEFGFNISISDISNSPIMLEGTGDFNGVNEEDPFPDQRKRLLHSIPKLKQTRYKIYKPVGDPKQFYLNMISIYTTYFIKKHQYPLSTMYLGYHEYDDQSKYIYAITYDDIIKNGMFDIIPENFLTKDEMDVIFLTCKFSPNPAIMTIKNALNVNSYSKIDSYLVNDQTIDQMIQSFDMSSKIIIANIKTHISSSSSSSNEEMILNKGLDDIFKEGLIQCKDLVQKINSNLKGILNTKVAKIAFTCKPHLFLNESFKAGIFEGCLSNKVCYLEYDYEIFGENLRNIRLIFNIRI